MRTSIASYKIKHKLYYITNSGTKKLIKDDYVAQSQVTYNNICVPKNVIFTHLINMSRSCENSQCFLFSTSTKPHFVCRPNTRLLLTLCSRSLPMIANGMRACDKNVCCYKVGEHYVLTSYLALA